MKKNTGKNFGAIQIVHALVWAGGMLLASKIFGAEPWAENLVPFMALAFVIVNGFLMSALTGRSQHCD